MNIDTPSRSAVDAGPETGPGTHTPDDPTDESGYATEQQSDEGEPGGFGVLSRRLPNRPRSFARPPPSLPIIGWAWSTPPGRVMGRPPHGR